MAGIALEVPTSRKSLGLFCFTCHVLALILHANALTTTSSTSIDATRTSAGNETDRLALIDFKSKIIHDPQGALSSWNSSRQFCTWEGVTCGRRHQRVTVLDLRSRNLVGLLSPYIGNMSFLRLIILFNNTLQGEIPQEVGRLFRLQVLGLLNNSFSGKIPTNLSHCSNLRSLALGSNMLKGKIPAELDSLLKLQVVSLHQNYLSGVIPTFIGNFTFLRALSLAINMLEGSIPDALGKLRSLTFLGLGANKLSGAVPSSIYNLSSITSLSLGKNKLYGSLPPDLFLTLPRLQGLQICGNQFSGSIPVSLSNASKLGTIDMSVNNFTGKISTIGGLQNLIQLVLWENDLGGGEADDMNFLGSLTNCSILEYVGLMGNRFKGTLPNYVGNLSNSLTFLALSGNQLYGVLPAGIGNLVSVTHLDLGINRFVGKIPSEFGNLQNVQRLFLNANGLSGEIPFSFGNLSSLNELYLDNNRLEGTIPSSVGQLKHLSLLDLSQNDLNGTIPSQLFAVLSLSVYLDLAKNRLTGSLPPAVGNLTNFAELDIYENKLSGGIPSDIGRCTSLSILYMEDNFFNGTIPSSLSSLKGIQNIDLSHNNLSGQIPEYFENFQLKSLNLSFNNFEGKVPTKGVFSNASAISVAGNNKLCGGISELKLPKCILKETKKQKMSRALLIALPVASAVVGIAVVSFLCLWFMKGRKEKSVGSLLKESLLKVSYQDLLKATDGFASANLIGIGSFGSVYKGILDETTVAVKVLDLQRRGASKSFTAECEALRNIRHRNLVKVLTSCSSVDFHNKEFKALVYEFMPNGNLDNWLHQTSRAEHQQDEFHNLDLLQRINIAIDVASALDYIHHQCEIPIVHCDLKPSNILLDSDMTAHVGDFGLARFLPELTNASQTSSLGIRGTVGYAAPEYGIGNEPSTYGDVYSYGVLVLEMITGKRPTESMFSENLNLHNFVKMALPDRVMEIVDPRLIIITIGADNEGPFATTSQHTSCSRKGSTSEECLRSLAKIGVACSVEAPQDRMNISKVVSELHSLRDILLQNGVRSWKT